MPVVRNLMIRIGADYSGAKKEMEGASKQLSRFKRETTSTASTISGRNGLVGIGDALVSTFTRIRGAKGINGVVGELKTLKPALSGATVAMRGLGTAATATSVGLGPLGIVIGVITATATAAAVALYKLSQPAVKFQADVGRLNISLHEGSRAYMEWADAQGLASSTAAELGATYGNLLGSFIHDTKQLGSSTQELVQATRIVASFTGRSLDDVFNRIRSGMLGSTEAIEDLGVFVNVSMIESTNAFKKFAGDKSWAQLDFQTQQQIRLAAILEQTYARYGNELQNNTMTKQELLMEQLKDIKLHWSQAFQPIWDSVIPALTRLAEGVSWLVEQFARLAYWVKGWDYDEMTKGTDKATDAVDQQAGAMDDLTKSTKAARKELASFDKLNLLGAPSGGVGGSGGAGGSGNGGGSGGSGMGGGSNSSGISIPQLPKTGLVFDPPQPPDAGMGAVATAVVNTADGMNAEIKTRMAGMWGDLQSLTQAGVSGQQTQWGNMWQQLQAQSANGRANVQAQINGLNADADNVTATSTAKIMRDWKTTLTTMQSNLATTRPVMSADWVKLGQSVTDLSKPLTNAQKDWHKTLDYQQGQINAYRPYLEWGWHLIGESIKATNPVLDSTEKNWHDSLGNMQQDTSTQLGRINADIATTTAAWQRMQQAVSQKPIMPTVPTPSMTATAPATSSSPKASVLPNLQSLMPDFKGSLSTLFSGSNISRALDLINKESSKPTNQIALSVLGLVVPEAKLGLAGKALQSVTGLGKKIIDGLKGLRGLGGAIPGFASGAVVSGPTLAMIGEYPGARNNPEVVGKLSDLEQIMGGNSDPETNALLRAILQAVKENRTVQAVIGRNDVGRAATDYIKDETKRGRNPLPAL